MDDKTDHIISNENDIPPVSFIKWPLDMDDDEFRAGYPFTPVPLEEVNEQEPWYIVSSKSKDNASQSVNSDKNDFEKTAEEVDKSSQLSFREQEELIKIDSKSSEMNDNNNDYGITINKKQDENEDKWNRDVQCGIVQTATNDRQINQSHPAK